MSEEKTAPAAATETPTVGTVPGSVSYDDILDGVADAAPPAEKPTKEDSDDGDTGAADGGGNEDNEGAESGDGPDSEDDSDEHADGDKAKAAKAKPKAAGKFTATTPDGKTVELDGSTKFKKKVEGKEIEITLEQALRHEAFDIPYAKKLEDLATKTKEVEQRETSATKAEKDWKKQAAIVAQHLRTPKEAIEKEDVAGFLLGFTALTGAHPGKVNAILRKHYLGSAKEYLEADETKRALLDKDEENKFLKTTVDQVEQTQQLQSRFRHYLGYAGQVKQQFGISDQLWHQACEHIHNEHLGGEAPNLMLAEPNQVQAYVESVVLQAQAMQQSSQVESLINKVSPKLKSENPKEFSRLSELLRPYAGKYDEADLIEAVKNGLKMTSDSEDDEEEEEAIPVADDQPRKARRKSASNSHEDELERVAREVEDDPLSVYA